MKKLVFFTSLFMTCFGYAQITLEKAFPNNENIITYQDGDQLYYVSTVQGSNLITIYNQDYTVFKTVNSQIPSNYNIYLINSNIYPGYSVSKYLFNADAKMEFFVSGSYYVSDTASYIFQSKIVNEDGIIVKDFGDVSIGSFYPYTDPVANKNKMVVHKYGLINNVAWSTDEIYSLPTSSLTTKEINNLTGNKLSAFPIPTSSRLNILNPRNGNYLVEITDISGKTVKTKAFGNENQININVADLPRGVYFYKIGNQSSKFIKE